MADTNAKIEKRREEARKRKEQNKKKANSPIKQSTKKHFKIAGCVLVFLLVLAIIIMPSMGVTRRIVPAVKIGDTSINTAEYSYYYQMAFGNYYQTMVQYLGEENVPIDLSRSLSKQDMSEDQTYADYFSNNAINTLTQFVVLNDEAKKAGFTLTEEQENMIEETIQQIRATATNNNMSLDDYFSANYSRGINEEVFRQMIRRELIAESYQEYKINEPVYTDEEREAYYAENKKNFSTVDLRYERFAAAAATETSEEVTADQAKEEAEAFLEAITDGKSFGELSLERAKAKADDEAEVSDTSLWEGVSYSSLQMFSADLADWAYSDDTKVGDKTLVEGASGVYYVAYLEATAYRNETKTANVRHILITVSDMENEEAKAAAKAEAEQLLNQWKENGGTEEAFAELANANSNDTGSNTTGGLYENVLPGQMVAGFNDWCFDPSRQPGDSGIVETNFGYHVMYYISSGVPTWSYNVDQTMRNEAYSSYYEEVSTGYEVSTNWLGMLLRNEPI